MGILDRFTKKNQEKQLEAHGATVIEPKKEKTEVKKSAQGGPALGGEEKVDKKKEVKKVTKSAKKSIYKDAHRTLVKPIVSEKAAVGESIGKYTFEVDTNTTKIEVKKAVQHVYGILPTKVRISNVEGKRVSFGRQSGKRKDWKKAVVTLPKGKTINIHEGV